MAAVGIGDSIHTIIINQKLSYRRDSAHADGVDFSVDDVYSALTLAHTSQTDGTDEP